MEWTSRVTTIALEMALPSLAGLWLDRRFGTKALFTILGVILGFVMGMWHLLKLAGQPPKPPDRDTRRPPEP